MPALLLNQLPVIIRHFQSYPDYAVFSDRHEIFLDKDSWHDLCMPYNMSICNIKRHMKGDITIEVPSDIMSRFQVTLSGSVGRVGGDSIVLVDLGLLPVAGHRHFPGSLIPRRLGLRSGTGDNARGIDFR